MSKVNIGDHILFVTAAGQAVRVARVVKFSPSGKYVGLDVDAPALEWTPENQLSVVEVLQAAEVANVTEAPAPAPAPAAGGSETTGEPAK